MGRYDAVQIGYLVGLAVDDLGVRVDQALGRRCDLRQLEHIAQLPRRLVGPLFRLSLQAVEQGPGGGALRVIAVLVVAPLLRHRARLGFPVIAAQFSVRVRTSTPLPRSTR